MAAVASFAVLAGSAACSTSAPAPSAVPTSAPGLGLYAGTTPAVTPHGTSSVRTLHTEDGLTRSYRLFMPDGDLGRAPLLVALHGGLGSAEQFEVNSGFDGLATSNGFLVVYPEGVGLLPDGRGGARTWNGGACCGPAAARDVDDVAFVRAVVRSVSAVHAVDADRVYLTGHSNGGILAVRIACEEPTLFAALAVQSATLGVDDCPPSRSISMLQIHGTADTNIPLDGGLGSGVARVRFAPPRTAAAAIAGADGCSERVTTATDPVNPDLVLERWSGCPDGVEVQFLAVTGAGHAWMGHPPASAAGRLLVGEPYPDLDASRTIWAFLAAHPRARPA